MVNNMDLIDLMPKGELPAAYTMKADLRAARLFATGAVSVFQSSDHYIVHNGSELPVVMDGLTIQPGGTVTIP